MAVFTVYQVQGMPLFTSDLFFDNLSTEVSVQSLVLWASS